MSLMVFGALSSSNLWAGDASAKLTKAPTIERLKKNLFPIPPELRGSIFSYLNFGDLVELYSSNKISSSDKIEIGRIIPEAALRSSLGELIEVHSSNKINDVAINAEIGQIILKKALGEFILLPEVTAQEAAALVQVVPNTSIREAIPAFRVAQTKTPVGLYYAVYGSFPDLAQVSDRNLDKGQIIAKWKANPELPLTFTTSDDDIALANRLSEMTGRRFSVTTNAQNEYSIRGRALVGEKPTGSITTSTYYFGNEAAQLSNHAWFYSDSGGSTHGVNENPSEHSHPFGLNQAIGNVFVRSSDGVLRGASFSYDSGWYAESSYSVEGSAGVRYGGIGSRLAELIVTE